MNPEADRSAPYSNTLTLKIPGTPGEIELTPVEMMVMSHAVEDWWALWELPADGDYVPLELKEARDQRAILLVAMRHLLELGLIEVGWEAWDATVPIESADDPLAVLEDPASWAPREPQVAFSATALGARLFQRDPEGA
jgi:hypothetical protein